MSQEVVAALPTPPSVLSAVFARFLWAWGYIQQEMLYLSWSLMDVALLTPLALALMPWARYWPPGQMLLWLWLVMLLPLNLGRFMGAMGLDVSKQRNVMAVTLLLLLYVTLGIMLYQANSLWDVAWVRLFFNSLGEADNLLWLRDISVFILTVLMWGRGLRLVGKTFELNRAGLRLRFGGLILAPVVIWLGYGRLLWDSTSFLMLFFLAGLTSISLIRAEEIERQRSGMSVALQPGWLMSVVGAASLITATAGLLGIMVGGQTADTIAGWLAPLWGAINFAASVVGATVAYLILPLTPLFDALIRFLTWLFSPIMQAWQQIGRFFPNFVTPTPEATATEEVIREIGVGGKINTILIMVLVVLLVTLALGRLYQRATLAARVPGGAYPLSRPDKTEEEGLGQKILRRLGLWRNWQTAVSIRRIYANMCRAAAVVGYPRAESETPYEYLRTLAQAWPDNTADAQLITQAYVKIRYGELPETAEELQAIKNAWTRLEQTRPVSAAVVNEV